jgi:hypothetical protein
VLELFSLSWQCQQGQRGEESERGFHGV